MGNSTLDAIMGSNTTTGGNVIEAVIAGNNLLATGWVGLLNFATLAYSCLCVYHGRIPLWPKDKITTGYVSSRYACYIACFNVFIALPIANVVLNLPYNSWYHTSLVLHIMGGLVMGPMIFTGFLSYMLGVGLWGVDDALPSESEGDRDEKATAPSSHAESETTTIDVDVEGGKRSTFEERLLLFNRLNQTRGALCWWIFAMATHTAVLNVMIWLVSNEYYGEEVNWFASAWFLLVLISGFCMGGVRYGFEMGETTKGWNLFLRFLAFFFFWLTVVSIICTQVLLAATSRNAAGGLPIFEGLKDAAEEFVYYTFMILATLLFPIMPFLSVF